MSENLETGMSLAVIPVEEQINQELVKNDIKDDVIATLKEKYMPLQIKGTDDKETYLLVKDARKECKALRVRVQKICKMGREEAVKIQKAWVAKEKDVTDKISEVEDYLQKQEEEFEAAVAKEKADRARKIEEQWILRQAEITKMGALYSDGHFVLGEVSFEMASIKECEPEIWEESILPLYKSEYEKIEAERLEQERVKAEKEAEFKRQQDELARQQKEMEELQVKMKREKEILDEQKREGRVSQLLNVTWNGISAISNLDGSVVITADELVSFGNNEWHAIRDGHNALVEKRIEDIKQAEAAERERQEKTTSRCRQLSELGLVFDFNDSHYKGFGCFVPTLDITGYSDEKWDEMIEKMISHIANYKYEQEQKRLAEIEAQKEVARRNELRKSRLSVLRQYEYDWTNGDIADPSDETWDSMVASIKTDYEKKQREKWEKEQEEKRQKEEAERLAKMEAAKDKEKWDEMMAQVAGIEVYEMRSSQYRTKAKKFRDLLDQIKAL